MSEKVVVTKSYLQAIADAIRQKLDVETEYKPSEMASAILQIGENSEVNNNDQTEA